MIEEAPQPTNAMPPDEKNLSHREYAAVIWSHLLGLFTLGLFPLIVHLQYKKRNPFVAYHSLQSLLLVIPIVCSMALATRFIKPLNIIYIYACTVLWVAMALVAASNANQGRWFELPVFGRVAKRMLAER